MQSIFIKGRGYVKMGDTDENSPGTKVTLLVNGKRVLIKKIIQNMLAGGVLGLITPLKGVDDPKHVNIEVELT